MTGSPPPAVSIVERRKLELPRPAPVPSSGPGPGEQDIVFVSRSTGFLTASDGIERTTDGGRTWKTVWRRAGVLVRWIGRQGRDVVASGAIGIYHPSGHPTSVLVRSGDDGRRWTVTRVKVPSASLTWDWWQLDLRYVTASEVYAVPSSEFGEATVFHGLLRSTDGGRRWRDVRLPGGIASGGVAFVNPGRGFVTGSTRRCVGRIWRTTDGGGAWSAVPGTCVPFLLDALSFPTPGVGLAAGGGYAKYGAYPQLAVLGSADGGETWRARFKRGGYRGSRVRGPYGPFASLSFADALHGYALVGGCTMGANGPCPGDAWITDDGGRRWRNTDMAGTEVALAGRDTWLVNPRGPESSGDVLWHSSDRGGKGEWEPEARVASLAMSSLVASGGLLFAHTDAGDFESLDAGAHWKAADDPALAIAEQRGEWPTVVEPSGLVIVANGSSSPWVSHDGGRTGSLARPLGFADQAISSVTFTDARHGLALAGPGIAPMPLDCANNSTVSVLATVDGGSSWRKIAALPMAQSAPSSPLSSGGGTAVATGLGCGVNEVIAISRDGGARWVVHGAPRGLINCQPSAAGRLIALWCIGLSLRNAGAPPAPAGELLVSDDSGSTWSAYQTTASIKGVAATPGHLWLYGEPGTLWSSTDAGVRWRAITPALPVSG